MAMLFRRRPVLPDRPAAAAPPACILPLERRVLMSFQPDGEALRLNETSERFDNSPDVAMDANGDFVAVWQSNAGLSPRVVARRFDRNGRPLTGDIVVSAPAGWGTGLDVATDDRGNFVVTWTGAEPGGPPERYARLFDHHGRPRGDAIRVDPGGEPTPGHIGEVAAAMSGDGRRFFLAWRERDDRPLPPEVLPPGVSAGTRGQVMRGRLFDGDGAALGDAFTVHASDERTARREVAAAMDDDGDLVVTWQHFGFGPRPDGVFARRFDPDGAPLTGDVLVNEPGGDDERGFPSAAMQSDGDFVIAWRDERGPGTSLLARQFTAAGTPAGGPTLITTYNPPSYSPVGADVATDDDGSFLASWRLDEGVFARHFDPSGNPRGGVMNLGTGNGALPHAANVAMDPKGRYAAVVWSRNDAPAGAPRSEADDNVYARLLHDRKRNAREAATASSVSVRKAYIVTRLRDLRPWLLARGGTTLLVSG